MYIRLLFRYSIDLIIIICSKSLVQLTFSHIIDSSSIYFIYSYSEEWQQPHKKKCIQIVRTKDNWFLRKYYLILNHFSFSILILFIINLFFLHFLLALSNINKRMRTNVELFMNFYDWHIDVVLHIQIRFLFSFCIHFFILLLFDFKTVRFRFSPFISILTLLYGKTSN